MNIGRNLLIVSYYFPPCNYVAANRPEYFARMFSNLGYEVDVVTRQWEGNEKNWEGYLNTSSLKESCTKKVNKNLSIHYLPYNKFQYPNSTFKSKLSVLQNYIKGNFHFELDSSQFLNYCYQLAEKKKYSYLLVSSPPLNQLATASILSKKFNIPLIVDFRDFQNHITLSRNTKLNTVEKIEHYFLMRSMKEWLKNADLLFSVTPLISHFITQISGKEVFTLMNGFDEELLSLQPIENRKEFVLSFIGTLYPYADVDILYNGLKLFFSRYTNLSLKINFIGVTMLPTVAETLRKIIPEKNVNITDRLPKQDAINIALGSHILFLVGFTEWQGVLPTKFFEYLGLRKNILQVPGDRGIIEDTIKKLDVGKTPHTAEEMCLCIFDWYKEWEESGTIAYRGKISEIQAFSRETQFNILSEKLKAI